MQVRIAEAAKVLRISEHTVRRRLAKGELTGIQVAMGTGGFQWIVDLPDELQMDSPESGEIGALKEFIATLNDQVEALRGQLESKDRQMEAEDNQLDSKTGKSNNFTCCSSKPRLLYQHQRRSSLVAAPVVAPVAAMVIQRDCTSGYP
jgi:predicted ArsR family transcriptional regulator